MYFISSFLARRRGRTQMTVGFTLIELLVVISIIGLIATLAMVAINNSRVKGRDAKRMASMRQLHQSMEVCSDTNGGSYTSPTACCSGWLATRDKVFECTGGLVVSMPNISTLKDPANVPTVDCIGSNSTPCEFTFSAAPTANAYTVYFYLEGNGGQNKTLTQLGIQ